jgi:nitrate/nitrite transporter NarK
VFFVNLAVGVPVLLIAPRLLHETRDESSPLPDALGTALLAGGVALLALGIVKGPDWGWTSGRVLGAFAASAVALALCVVRSSRHRAPVLELSLFRSRALSVASVSTVAFSIAFYGMLLANVLYLTSTWGYSTLRAGVALTPGPIAATFGAMAAGRLSDRYGQRVVAIPGALIFTVGAALLALLAQPDAAYATHFLPAVVLTGLGVGLSYASLASAAVLHVPPARYATGSALVACARQIGAVLGIALVIAIVQAAAPGAFVGAYQDAFTLIAACGAATAVGAAALGPVRSLKPVLVGSPAVEQATPSV